MINKKSSIARVRAESFSGQHVAIAKLMDAFSHPARVAIVETLAARGTCICGELVGVVPLAQSTVSQHLRHLRESGVIQGEIDGAKSCYCLDVEELRHTKQLLENFFNTLLQASCCSNKQCSKE